MNKKYTLGVTLIALTVALFGLYAYNASETESMFSFKKISSFRNHNTDHKGMNEFGACLDGKCDSKMTAKDKTLVSSKEFNAV